jgi:hypothetical protein
MVREYRSKLTEAQQITGPQGYAASSCVKFTFTNPANQTQTAYWISCFARLSNGVLNLNLGRVTPGDVSADLVAGLYSGLLR